ncbi:hypothetical protein ABVK25_000720 [Lepraria finkii]|uniref:Uncharacterized protein n=1 Tax=Lepraria finkii TaxID=1340010 RepID=A0ABR4BNP3_9LECA
MSAQRPLKAGEFIAAVTVDSEGHCFLWNNADILSICCNFIVYDDEQDVLRFAHLSVQEYLEKRQQYTDLATHSLALERCLHVIREPAQSDTTASALTVSLNQTFRPYAILYWPMHLQSIEGRGMDDTLTQKLFYFLFETSSTSQAFAKWISTLDKLSATLQWNDQLKSILQNVGSEPPNPIFLACTIGFLTILRRQSTFSRMDWNVESWQGNTGLHLCARFGQISCLEFLLGTGADVHVRTGEMETALYWSVKSIPEEFFKPPMLVPRSWVGRSLEQRKATASKIYGWCALHKAAYHGQTAAVRLLMENGADIEAKDDIHGATPLQWAVAVGNEVMVTLLLDLGADVNAVDLEDKWTPLHRASDRGHAAMVGLLLEGHAGINCKSEYRSWTALHLAADKGHELVVRLLLEKGADTNVKTKQRGSNVSSWESWMPPRIWSPINCDTTEETPLELAVKGRHQAVVQLLQVYQ